MVSAAATGAALSGAATRSGVDVDRFSESVEDDVGNFLAKAKFGLEGGLRAAATSSKDCENEMDEFGESTTSGLSEGGSPPAAAAPSIGSEYETEGLLFL